MPYSSPKLLDAVYKFLRYAPDHTLSLDARVCPKDIEEAM
jgi:hypothetical protein